MPVSESELKGTTSRLGSTGGAAGNKKAPVIDDFVRSFLQTNGLTKTLESFQVPSIVMHAPLSERLRSSGASALLCCKHTDACDNVLSAQTEWYELKQQSKLSDADSKQTAPDVYVRNQDLVSLATV